MSKRQKAKGLTPTVALISDLLCLPITIGPGAVAWSTALVYVRHFWNHSCFWALTLPLPLIIYFSYLVTVVALRMIIPKMKKGVYPSELNRGMLAWYLNLALNRSAYVSGLKPLIQSFHFTKFLYWRAMGAKIAFNVNTSIGITLVDLPMITIGPGCTIAENSHISCHTFVGDRLLIAPLELGKNVFLGMNCIVGAGSRIGDDTTIGVFNKIHGEKIPAGTNMPNFSWEHGSPERVAREAPK